MAPISAMMKIALSAAALAPAVSKELEPSFDGYLEDHEIGCTGEEKETKRSIYHAALKTVDAHNANPKNLWKMGINKFTVLSPKEMLKNFGYMKQTGKDRGVGAVAPTVKTDDLPTDFDWRTHPEHRNVVTAVKNQGACGSCWAFAATATLETAVAIATGVLYNLSPQQITSCAPNPEECGGSGGCSGATAQVAFDYVIDAGITSLWSYPYLSGTTSQNEVCQELVHPRVPRAGIQGMHQLPQNDAEALLAAVNVNPVSISVAAGDWSAYASGIFDGCDQQHPIINHAVVLMGYGVDNGNSYWLVRNSWGPRWGEFGYIRVLRRPGAETCGQDNEPLDGYSCKANAPDSIKACGMCGILADSVYPTGAYLGTPEQPEDPAFSTSVQATQVIDDDLVSDSMTRGIAELGHRTGPLAMVAGGAGLLMVALAVPLAWRRLSAGPAYAEVGLVAADGSSVA